jgi:hypothetical protein
MNGEALPGPLPAHFKLVSCILENPDFYVWVFINHKTGMTRIEDPRLAPLPTVWWLEHLASYRSLRWFVNNENGAKPTAEDQRLTPEALRERGVG